MGKHAITGAKQGAMQGVERLEKGIKEINPLKKKQDLVEFEENDYDDDSANSRMQPQDLDYIFAK